MSVLRFTRGGISDFVAGLTVLTPDWQVWRRNRYSGGAVMNDQADLRDVKLVPVAESWWQKLLRRLQGKPVPLEFVARKPRQD